MGQLKVTAFDEMTDEELAERAELFSDEADADGDEGDEPTPAPPGTRREPPGRLSGVQVPTPKQLDIRWLPISTIRVDGGTQSRVRLDPTIVQDYAQEFSRNAEIAPSGTVVPSNELWWGDFPPLEVYFDEEYWLADGFHRLEGMRKALADAGLSDSFSATNRIGNWRVLCKVHLGSRRDAILHAAGANANHGLRRTNADKRKAVETLLRDEEWQKWTDVEIARRCSVDPKTVGNIRHALSQSLEIPMIDVRKAGDGRVVNTSPIGRKPEPLHASLSHLQDKVNEWLALQAKDGGDPSILLPILQGLKETEDSDGLRGHFIEWLRAQRLMYKFDDLMKVIKTLHYQLDMQRAQASAKVTYTDPAPNTEPVPADPAVEPAQVPDVPDDLHKSGYRLWNLYGDGEGRSWRWQLKSGFNNVAFGPFVETPEEAIAGMVTDRERRRADKKADSTAAPQPPANEPPVMPAPTSSDRPRVIQALRPPNMPTLQKAGFVLHDTDQGWRYFWPSKAGVRAEQYGPIRATEGEAINDALEVLSAPAPERKPYRAEVGMVLNVGGGEGDSLDRGEAANNQKTEPAPLATNDVAELAAAWPAMPDLADGIDRFAAYPVAGEPPPIWSYSGDAAIRTHGGGTMSLALHSEIPDGRPEDGEYEIAFALVRRKVGSE